MQNWKLEREVKKQRWIGEVHSRGEGPRWTVVLSKKEEEKKKKKKKKKKKNIGLPKWY